MRQLIEKTGDSSGMALLVTLLVLVILAVLVNQFTFATRVHLGSAAYLRDQFQAECMARSGVEVALGLLEQDEDREIDHLGEPWALFKGSEEISSQDEMEGSFAVKILDESAKVDINRLVQPDGTTDPFVLGQMERLLEAFDITPDRLDALLDWLDPDDDRRGGGAEDSDYQALKAPYPCRNGPLRTLGELRLVSGWQDAWDIRLEDGRVLADCLTIGPSEGRININTASSVVLQSLDSEIDADKILTLREETPLESLQGLIDSDVVGRIQGHIQFGSSLFSIQSDGAFRRALFRIHVRVQKSENGLLPVQWRIE